MGDLRESERLLVNVTGVDLDWQVLDSSLLGLVSDLDSSLEVLLVDLVLVDRGLLVLLTDLLDLGRALLALLLDLGHVRLLASSSGCCPT